MNKSTVVVFLFAEDDHTWVRDEHDWIKWSCSKCGQKRRGYFVEQKDARDVNGYVYGHRYMNWKPEEILDSRSDRYLSCSDHKVKSVLDE